MSVPTNLIPTPITGLPEYTGSSTLGYMPYVIDGQTFKVQFTNIAAVGAVPSTRVIASGTGLAGGGDLSADRVISIAAGGVGVNQLSLTGVTAGTYGSGSDVPVLTVDATGRVTSATTAALSVTGFVPTSRTITAGNGLTGGGSLASDITLSANFSATTPLALGSATAGVAITLSRGDHVHPALDLSDTNQTQGALPLGRGGTGDALSPVAGAVVYSTGTKFALSALGSVGQVLVSNGTGAPVWTTLPGTGTVTSVNLTAGTGISVSGGPITTSGSINVVNTAPDQVVSLTGAGTTVVTGTYPSFTITSTDSAAGTVTSVNASGGTTGLSFTGGPITTSGTLTLGGTLAIANGGTGAIDAPTALTNLGAYPASNPSGFTSNVGTVTSVSGTGTVSGLSLSGTVTSAGSLTLGGTLAVLPSNFASQTANTVLAAPNGSAGTPTFRAIVAADVPTLNQNTTGTASNVTGIVAVLNGGTGASVAGTARTNLLAAGSGANTDITSIALTTGTVSATPTSGTDIVNKLYADSIASGINFHQSVRLATAAALPANTYNNGSSGVGATLTANANGALTVDGVAAVAGNRILVKNEAAGANNGVYTVTQVGDGSTPYILTRATDFDSAGTGVDQIDAGDFFLVTAGSTQSNTSWVQQTPLPITVGTTALVFTQFAAPVLYSAGTGLTLAGTVFSITNTGVAASTYGSASSVPVIAVNAQGQATSVTNTPIAIAATQITSGTFTVGQGGTGQSSYTDGQLLIGNTTGNTLTKATLTAGTNVSITNGSGAITINAADQFVGTVTSVSGTGTVSGLTLTGTVTTSGNLTLGGTLAVTASDFASQTAKTFLAAPNASSGVPSFRAIIPADVPTLNQNTTGTASNVTGTVAVANGGTGTATAFTTGSVVFAGASGVYTQDNANLFWDDTNNRLGIGTTSPTAPLSVTQDNVAFRGQLSLQTASATNIAQITFYDQSTLSAQIYQSYGANKEINIVNPLAAGIALWTTNAERMRINASGNVGIGTSSPGTKLDVVGTINASDGTNGNIRAYVDGTSAYLQSLNQAANAYRPLLAMGSTVSFANNGVTNVTIDTSGNLLVGTTTASYSASGRGVAILGGSASGLLGFQIGGVAKGYVGHFDTSMQVWNEAASPILFGTSATERMRIDSSGNVGIGTSSPTKKLMLGGQTGAQASPLALQFSDDYSNGSTAAKSKIFLFNDGGSNIYGFGVGSNADVQYHAGATGLTDGNHRFYTNDTERMRIDGSGNVGIGTSAPVQKLHVVGLINSSDGATSRSVIGWTSAATWGGAGLQLINVDNSNLILGTNNTGRLLIDTNGNVGIGTSSPGAKLTVIGSASKLYIDLSGDNYYDAANHVFRNFAGTERARIDSSGNLMVGTTTADNKLTVSVSSTGAAAGVASLVNPNDGVGTAADLDFVTHSSGTLATGRIRGVAVGADDYALAFSSYGSGGIAERMRITGPGDVGIGNASIPYTASGRTVFNVNGTSSAIMSLQTAGSNRGYLYADGSLISLETESGVTLRLLTNAAQPITFSTNGTERMRIDSSGNVGIGLTNASAYGRLVVGDPADTANNVFNMLTRYATFSITADATTAANGALIDVSWANGGQGPLRFGFAGTERMRIDSSGNLLVGTTATVNAAKMLVQFTSVNNGLYLDETSNTSGTQYVRFSQSGTTSGSITRVGTTAAVLYNTSSDVRLKENIADADNASSLIDALQVRKFDWKAGGEHQRYGFVAQELVTVAPEAVHQPADPDDMMGVDYSKLVPMLIKEIQSLRARVAQLEGK